MTKYEWVSVALTVVAVLLIPVIVILVRGAIKWTHVEDKLSELVTDVGQLVANKDKVHSEMLEQMRLDREATDRRLRFIEEWFMNRGKDAIRNP